MLTLRKYKFSEHRKFILIFALGRTAILFTIFYHAIKIDYLFMFYNNIIKDYSKKNMENKKNQKQKNITRPIKKNYKKDPERIIEILINMRKLKKETIVTLEI